MVQIVNSKQMKKKMSSEMYEIFSNLNEGIIVVQNNSIKYTNEVYESILKSVNIMS